MVDQNSNGQGAPNQHPPEATYAASSNLSSPTVVKAGEMMLIFALVLIFLVCLAAAIHLYLRRQKRRRKAKNKKTKGKKEVDAAPAEPELGSQERKIAELVGTPVCEIGESEPRHEMEDVEVPERHTTIDLQNPRDSPVVSPLTPYDLEAGTMYYGEMTTGTLPEPDARQHARYWFHAL